MKKDFFYNSEPEAVNSSAPDPIPPKVAEVLAKERQAARQASKQAKEAEAKAKELETQLANINAKLEEFGGLDTISETFKTKQGQEQTASEREKTLQDQLRQTLEDSKRKEQQLREQQALIEADKQNAYKLVEETEIKTAIKEALIANRIKPDNMDLLLDSPIIRKHVKYFKDGENDGVYPVDATKYPLLDPENPSNNMSLEAWIRTNVVPKRKDLFETPMANGDGLRGKSGKRTGMDWESFKNLSGSQALSVARGATNSPRGKR